jgi:hypothetical protein
LELVLHSFFFPTRSPARRFFERRPLLSSSFSSRHRRRFRSLRTSQSGDAVSGAATFIIGTRSRRYPPTLAVGAPLAAAGVSSAPTPASAVIVAASDWIGAAGFCSIRTRSFGSICFRADSVSARLGFFFQLGCCLVSSFHQPAPIESARLRSFSVNKVGKFVYGTLLIRGLVLKNIVYHIFVYRTL